MAAQVGFLFVTFRIKLVSLGEKFPIYMLRTFTCIINFMLSKFRRKPVKGTFVKPGNKTFHHLFCKQLQILKTRNLINLFFYIHPVTLSISASLNINFVEGSFSIFT